LLVVDHERVEAVHALILPQFLVKSRRCHGR